MNTEFEVKILEIDVQTIKLKLQELGAEFIGEFNQKRYVFDFNPKVYGKWIRLRTNGKTTTLTIKETKTDQIDGTKELETEVGDIVVMNNILQELGYNHRAYQENKRISYKLEGVSIEIDSWPLIPSYLEIEGESINEVEKIVHKLGFDFSETTSINTTEVYKRYGIDIEPIKELIF